MLQSRLKEERGATIAIVAISLIALFGMIVLTVDVGGVLLKRRDLVNGSDAAALAAAQKCATGDAAGAAPAADALAADNVSGSGLAGGITASQGCGTSAKGYVTVNYHQPKQLFFAPVLGFGNTTTVAATATAAWGPAASGGAVPIVVDAGQLQGQCHIPDGVSMGDVCALWYNNGDFALGDANWGFMNLDQWNVLKDANCSSSGGSSSRGGWIQNNYPTQLTLNAAPGGEPGSAPTYVCGSTGHATDNWQDLNARMAKDPIVEFPVNDCNGQVDKSGTVVPCPGTPDKYDIIGFTVLKLTALYRGDDPAAIGTPASSGSCNNNNLPSLLFGQTLNLDSFGAGQGCYSGTPDSITGVVVTQKVGPTTTTYNQCLPGNTSATCDYWYDSSVKPHTITWRHAAVTTEKIDFNWGFSGSAGACGSRSPDPNAICIVTEWQSFNTGPGAIGGQDFGVRNIRLCDKTITGSCPS